MAQVDPHTLNQIASNIDASFVSIYKILMGLSFILAVFVKPIINIFFAWSCYSTMKKVPSEKQIIPGWMCWLFVIPIAGYVFEWIMLPFAIPRSIRNHLPDNEKLNKKTRSLFAIGLIYLILEIGIFFPGLIIPVLIFWIIYWVKVKDIRTLL